MKVYTDKTLHDDSFVIEEVCFVNCTLKNCHLFYSGGDCEWVNTNFDGCHFHFLGAAKKTKELLQQIGLLQAPGKPKPTGTIQ